MIMSVYAKLRDVWARVRPGSPALSVIVANYNNEQYLAACLDSVLTQSWKDLEIVVCDDCSTDDSIAILDEYANARPAQVRVLQNRSNMGVTRTRHLAICKARGRYITTLDADDYYDNPEKLQREMELLLNHKDKSGADIIAFSNIALVSDDRTLIRLAGQPENLKEGRVLNDIMCRSCMIPRDFVMRRDLYFQVGGYDFEIPLYEDWDLKIRLAAQVEYRYTGVIGTAYRRHGRGLSAAPVRTHIKWMQGIFDKNLPLIHSKDQEVVKRRFNQMITTWEKRAAKENSPA